MLVIASYTSNPMLHYRDLVPSYSFLKKEFILISQELKLNEKHVYENFVTI